MTDEAETIGQRLKRLRGTMSREVFASKIAVHRETLSKYERGVVQPGADVLGRIRAVTGADMNWLLTGKGEAISATDSAAAIAKTPAAPLDEELMGRLVDGILTVYKEEGVRLPPVDLGRLVARFQTDLVAAYDDPDERRIGLKMVLQKLRSDLRAHPSDDQGKRLA